MKTIAFSLDVNSIDRAIGEIEKVKKSLQTKVYEFLKELAKVGYDCALREYETAVYDGTNDVTCKIEELSDREVAVVATGDAVLFIEFGTGVIYPDSHPEAHGLGMSRGGYGHGRGRSPKGWNYIGEPGTNGEESESVPGLTHTYGNPANACLYHGKQMVEEEFVEIAKRVFRNE